MVALKWEKSGGVMLGGMAWGHSIEARGHFERTPMLAVLRTSRPARKLDVHADLNADLPVCAGMNKSVDLDLHDMWLAFS